ncbi:hypothetical protein KIN20_002809 [Parelaphostrongylus tenuis]|uniref:Uncharacterized protein n=1 Tax=Parelaphostrongylus tenuis TaxID=148309 RepID=A0AAD5QDR9_PARTN|nr:hypothetical protein KIN20_002809 [Parelaphostrongylus tenuis]
MYIQKGDLLSVQQSASKPSLFSSYWSIHAQIQNSEQLDVDVKNCSKSSLPDAFELKSHSLRGTKSLSDLTMGIAAERSCISSRNIPILSCDRPPRASNVACDNVTNRITEWLTAIDLQENVQNV